MMANINAEEVASTTVKTPVAIFLNWPPKWSKRGFSLVLLVHGWVTKICMELTY